MLTPLFFCLAEKQEHLEKKYQNKMKRYDAQLDNLERERRAQDVENMKAHMFLFMYVSDTDVPVVHGLYMGKDTYIVDLRKALPSTFLRPVSQHGWIVKGKKKDFDFDRNVACVIRIAIERVDEWIGTGHLLSQDNFFPEPDRDLGYHMLLSRQEQSGIGMKKRKILPKDMVMSINSGNGK